MPMLPLISVIVPIYKVEAYLHRCVESILNQTYANLEVILVDDGSPDNCGAICDDFAGKDKRVRVIHRKNGGLSAARNSGLEVAAGEYIAFVDSDDCIHPEMYERLYRDICEYGVRLAFCQANKCYGTIAEVDYTQPTVCERKEYVITRSLKESIWWAAWTKLYHRSLLDGIRFPEGRTNEDYAVIMYVYDKCDRIAVNFNKLYNYCIRDNSICTSALNVRKFDQLVSAEEVLLYMKTRNREWAELAEAILMTSCLFLLYALHGDTRTCFAEQEAGIYRLIRKYFPTACRNRHILKTQRMLLLAARIHPMLYKCCISVYDDVKNKKK